MSQNDDDGGQSPERVEVNGALGGELTFFDVRHAAIIGRGGLRVNERRSGRRVGLERRRAVAPMNVVVICAKGAWTGSDRRVTLRGDG